jgi:two-component system sensor histidine kinase SenX3
VYLAFDAQTAVAGVAALAGLAVGTTAGFAFRWSERERRRGLPPPEPDVPAGAVAVLSVLRSSAVLLDASDAVVKASPAAYALGLIRDHGLTAEPILELAREVRRTGEIEQREFDLRRGRASEEPLAVSVRVAPLGATLVLVLVEDRTEARRIDAVRRDFVANVSHELKTPVGALSLLSEALLSAADDPEGVRRFTGRVRQESQRLTSLIQDLIDLSRVQDDDPLVEAHVVPLDEVLGEALDRAREAATARHIVLVAAGARDVRVLGSVTQLITAVGNLVENAVNYSPEHTRVVVAVREAGEFIEISVTDQGIGIADADIERIFERFYRVDPARSRATGGTGLGLAIVKHIAATHGGDVSVWSEVGSGSTFTLRLPALAATDEARAASVVRRPNHVPDI